MPCAFLDDSKVACVYCEWHDDYVVENAGVLSYQFHQVKTRALHKGPWTLAEFFGVKRRPGKQSKKASKQPTATTDSIFGRLFHHVSAFGDRCNCFVFVTDAGVDSDFRTLVDTVHAASALGDITGDPADQFNRMQQALHSAFPQITSDVLFAFLKRFYVRDTVGKLEDLKACRTALITVAGFRICPRSMTISGQEKDRCRPRFDRPGEVTPRPSSSAGHRD